MEGTKAENVERPLAECGLAWILKTIPWETAAMSQEHQDRRESVSVLHKVARMSTSDSSAVTVNVRSFRISAPQVSHFNPSSFLLIY